jgi:amidase
MITRRGFLGTTAALGALGAGVSSCRGPLPKNLAELDATGEAELITKRHAKPIELVEAAIARIGKLNPQLNFLAADMFEKARERAKRMKPTGAFGGVPFLLKDLLEYPGVPFKRGSRMFANAMGRDASPLVEAYEAAGLVVVGKTATPEFGLTASTESSLQGATRNPWNLGYTPGGSSGGSAAAVASGAVPFAHGTDGGGSIRIPASCCGLFGLKPSRGRMITANEDEKGLVISVNHCLSRSVRDSAKLLSVTERTDHGAPFPAVGYIDGPDPKRLTIAFSSKRFDGLEASAPAKAALEGAIDVCKSLGHTVVERDYPVDGRAFTDAFILYWAAGAYDIASEYKTVTGKAPDTNVLEPWTLGLASYYQMQPVDALDKALTYFQAVIAQVDEFFATVDVMLSPVVDGPAPAIGILDPRLPFVAHMAHITSFVAYTPIHNVAGTPAMSVPLYWTKDGLPIGSQFAARRGNEAVLFSLAYELEKAKPWIKRKPPVFAS